MAEGDARADGSATASPAPSAGRGRGFIAGVLGGLVGAVIIIYALQIPAVRDALPVPEAAELIVNPAAVARITALEAELAQVRNAAREAEETSAIDTLGARLDQLSTELTGAATTAQLGALRDELSVLATAEGAAALDERIAELAAELTALDEVAARTAALATVESAVQGFETRVGALEAASERLVAGVAALDAGALELATAMASLTDRSEADETALVERTAALTGRIDAFARNAAALSEAIGAADARFAMMRDEHAQAMERLAADLHAALQTIVDDVGAASTVAEGARDDATAALAAVEEVLARSRVAGDVQTAANALERALANGTALGSTVERLAAVDTTALPTGGGALLAEIRSTLAEHEPGVSSLGDLRDSFAQRADGLAAGVENGGDMFFGAVNLRARGAAGDTRILDRIDDALAEGDLEGAVAAAETLDEAAADAVAPWLDAARARLAVEQARDQLFDLARDVATMASAS